MKELRRSKRRGTATVVFARLRTREKNLREMLLARRQALVSQLRSELKKGLGRPAQRGLDLAEESELSVEMEIGLTTASTRSDMLKQIDRTLERLREGNRGICEDCGDAINAGRLKVMPFATRCTGCQERWETSSYQPRNGNGLSLEVRESA